MADRGTVAEQRLHEASRRLVDGVDRLGTIWIHSEALRVVEAWGRLGPTERARLEARLAAAAQTAARRVVSELRALFSLDVTEQRTTPLAVVRTIVAEPTAAIAEFGIPPVERDEFETRALPDDIYGLAPRDLAALGDPELGAVHVVWGMAKAEVVRQTGDSEDDFTEL